MRPLFYGLFKALPLPSAKAPRLLGMPLITRLLLFSAISAMITTAAAVEPQPLLKQMLPGAQSYDDPGIPRELTIVLPGIGGRSDRSIALRTTIREGRQVGRVHIRSWQFQDRLQPSHIRRLERKVEHCALELDGDGRLTGTLRLRLAGPAQLGNPAVTYSADITLDLLPHPGPPPELRDDFSTPPWRRVDFPLHGQLYQGTYSGTWQRDQQAPEWRYHAAWAGLSYRQLPGGPAVSAGDWPSALTVADDGRVHITAALPHHPVDASETATIEWRSIQPLALGGANALRVRYHSAAYEQVRVRFLLYDDNGQRWSFPHALPLWGNEREAILPLAGFQADWYTALFDLDTQAITGIGLAIPAAYGPGPVSLELLSVDAVYDPRHQAPSAHTTVSLHADRLLRTNGHRRIHSALFGVHGVGPVREEHKARVAALNIGSVRTIEHTGFGPKSNHIESGETRTLVEATGSDLSEAIHSFTMSLFDPPPWVDGLDPVLERMAAFGDSLGRIAANDADQSVPWIEVWNEPFIWGRHINKPYGTLIDPEQPGHLSGPLAARNYAAMYRALVEAARAHDSSLRFAGPSSSSFAGDDWRHLTNFVLPIVSANHDLLDAVSEHHYQGRGRQFSAEWLVADAAIQAIAGRSIPIWNTEANDLSDTPGGWGNADDRPARAGERKRAAYQVDEILNHLSFIPHLARGRAIHMLHHGRFLNRGEEKALHFLAPLRGELLPISSPDPRLAVAAAHDGDAVIAVVYNDRHIPVTIAFDADVPQPEARLSWSPEQGSTIEAIADGDDGLTIAPLTAVRYRLTAPRPSRVIDRQIRPANLASGGAAFLIDLAPGDSLDLRFADVPAGQATQLWLVSEGLADGDAHLVVNDGQQIPLAAAHHLPKMIQRIPIPADLTLGDSLRLVANAEGLGFRLGTLYAVWEHEAELAEPE